MGMSCASCSARVEKTLNHQSGVKKAVVNYASATATVEYDPTNCSSEALQQAVQAAGYDLLINQDGNTLEATQIMLESRVVEAFPLNDQEILCRHLHKEVGDRVAEYRRELEEAAK